MMIDTLPVAVSLLYLAASFLVVICTTSIGVAVVARRSQIRLIFIGLAVLGLAAAGYQYCTALYYQSVRIADAARWLIWQVDYATVSLLAVAALAAIERQHSRSLWFWLGLVLTGLLMVGLNRSVPYSIHFSSVDALFWNPAGAGDGLRVLRGTAALALGIWMVGAVVLTAYAGYAYLTAKSGITLGARPVILTYLVAQTVALVQMGLIDFTGRSGVYLNGYAFTVFALLTTYRLAAEAAQRSRELTLRDRQMQAEIIQRRQAEDKLRRLSQVFMQAAAPTHIIDRDGATRQVNEASLRFLHRDVSVPPRVNFFKVLEQLGESPAQVISQMRHGDVREFGPYRFAAGKAVDNLYLTRDAWLRVSISPIFDQQRQLEELVVQLEDITEKQFVSDAISTISMSVSAETGHAFFKKIVVYLARLLGCKYIFIGLQKVHEGRSVLETLAAVNDGELVENFRFELHQTLTEQVLKHGTFTVARDVQAQFPGQTHLCSFAPHSFLGAAIEDEQKRPIGVLAILDTKPLEHLDQAQQLLNIFVSRASTELQRIEKEETIRRMAFEDQLTGLPNRSHLQEYIGGLLDAAAPESAAFIQIDLDHFKTINDALGHDIGDDVLRILGKRLTRFAEPGMLVTRIGGDEFVVVVGGLDQREEFHVDAIATRISRLMEKPVQVGDHLLDIGCTMGIVIFPGAARTVVDVFRSADTALHQAKSAGRGGYKLFTPAMREAVDNRLKMEKGLRSALLNDELRLHYQPQINAWGELVGAEALVRWQHPDQGLVPPYQFIPIAEETGLINPIGHWVLQQALKHCGDWQNDNIGFNGRLSVNVSAWQFARPDFVKTSIDAIEKSGINPHLITFEMTESAVLADVSETIEKLSLLRAAGISIALDDFGTGYSSLAYLRDLPLDRIKIDKSFVDALEFQPHEPLVESMISIGRHMGLEVIAEGVETQVQLERLRNLGCTVYQGYYFARPMGEEAFRDWLRARAE